MKKHLEEERVAIGVEQAEAKSTAEKQSNN